MTDYDINESDFEQTSKNDDSIENENNSVSDDHSYYEYNVNGKTVKEDIDTILKRAGMGYNYAQHMNEFKQQKTEFQQQIENAKNLENKWRPYEDYAVKNPSWADHVRSSFENRDSFNSQNNEQALISQQQPQELNGLMSEFNQLKEAYYNDKKLLAEQQQDQELNSQIESVKKEYADIDFSHTDPNSGKSLEFQVLEHGSANGISNFRAAFRDFYHDQLVSIASSKAKENVAKELQKRQQKGFMSESDTPQLVTNNNRNSYKNKSYYELAMEGIKDFNSD